MTDASRQVKLTQPVTQKPQRQPQQSLGADSAYQPVPLMSGGIFYGEDPTSYELRVKPINGEEQLRLATTQVQGVDRVLAEMEHFKRHCKLKGITFEQMLYYDYQSALVFWYSKSAGSDRIGVHQECSYCKKTAPYVMAFSSLPKITLCRCNEDEQPDWPLEIIDITDSVEDGEEDERAALERILSEMESANNGYQVIEDVSTDNNHEELKVAKDFSFPYDIEIKGLGKVTIKQLTVGDVINVFQTVKRMQQVMRKKKQDTLFMLLFYAAHIAAINGAPKPTIKLYDMLAKSEGHIITRLTSQLNRFDFGFNLAPTFRCKNPDCAKEFAGRVPASLGSFRI